MAWYVLIHSSSSLFRIDRFRFRVSVIQARVTGGSASSCAQLRARGFMPKMTPVLSRVPEVAVRWASIIMEVSFAFVGAISPLDSKLLHNHQPRTIISTEAGTMPIVAKCLRS